MTSFEGFAQWLILDDFGDVVYKSKEDELRDVAVNRAKANVKQGSRYVVGVSLFVYQLNHIYVL
ncbi:MAG: hypothetical protein ACYCQJ_09395 [Nitrososphaerales archaeon]